MSSDDETGRGGGREDDHQALRLLLGAYVLGGLDPADRELVDRHLPGCARCRDQLSRSAPIPGLLSRLPATARPGAAPPAAPSGALLQQLLTQVDARRTAPRARRRSLLAAAAVITLLLGGLGGLGLQRSRPSDQASRSVVLVAAAGGSGGQAQLVAKPWGTAMTLRLSDLPAQGPFTLEVVGSDGQRERAATWGASSSARIEVTGATSLAARDVAGLRVLGPAGQVLTATL